MAQLIAQRFPIDIPILNITAGHLYIALVDNDTLVTELHGLAFDPVSGNILAVGSEDDFIKAFQDPAPPNNLYSNTHLGQELLTGTVTELQDIVSDYLVPMMEYINSNDFRYKPTPTTGEGLFNSNSVFRAFTEALKVARPDDTALQGKIDSAFSLGGGLLGNPGTNADILLGDTWSPNLSDQSGLGYPYMEDLLSLPVKDIEATSSWYQKTLGLIEVDRTDTPNKTVLMERDGVKLGFSENGGDSSQDGAAILVSDIYLMRTELEEKDVQISNWRIEERENKKYQVFFVKDPDELCYYFHQLIGE